MNAVKYLMICLILLAFLHVACSHEIEGVCLPGMRHKPKPTPEDDSYKACHVFKNSSCCTSEFTNQLAVDVVQRIGNFSWTLCGRNLSRRCQDYMIGVECFYSCSPYVGLWADPNYNQSFNNAPVCSSYCDDWYEACKDDFSCAKNWIFDFNFTADGHNKCKRNCTTFKELYKDGKELCETMWDDSFNYTENKDLCLHFRYNSTMHNPNKDVVQKIFGHSGTHVLPTSNPGNEGTHVLPTSNPGNEAGALQGAFCEIFLALSFYLILNQL